MIRSLKFSLSRSNLGKLEKLEVFHEMYMEDLKFYIELLKNEQLPIQSFLSTKLLPINKIKHSQIRLSIYQQAVSIIRSNINLAKKRIYKKYKKLYYKCSKENKHQRFLDKHFKDLNINYLKRINIDLKKCSMILGQNLIDFENGKSFDEFVRIRLPWNKENKKIGETINLPFNFYKYSRKYSNWNRRNTISIIKQNNQFFLTLFFEKEEVKKSNQQVVGLDIGYNKLISDSNGVHWGKELKEIYNRLSKKKRGSKNYKQLLHYKMCKINEVVNKFINFYKDTNFVCENLKNVKHASKLYKSLNNKLQYWSYRQVLDKLDQLSEIEGFNLTKIDPAYTSQTCSKCGSIIKSNRNGEFYNCSCGLLIDADTNAAINILHRGTNSSSNK